jgi:HSP20 family protein
MTFFITPYHSRMRWPMERWGRDDELKSKAVNEIFFPVDVAAETDAFVLTALLPGIKAEDLDIQIANETVSLQGELTNHRDEKGSYLLLERPVGHFSRVLTLPAELDAAHAEASLEDGVLTLRVPKAETARPKSIKVNPHG